MLRRRLSERQLKRIQALQQRRREQRETRAEQQLDAAGDGTPQAGLVVVRHGANLAVERADGRVFHCVSRRHIGDPVCGDQVIWRQTDPNTGVVTAIEPRRTELSRPDAAGRVRALAANLSQIVIVLAPEPPPTGDLLDQYLIAAETLGVQALLVCNKADRLASPAGRALLEELAPYQGIGYACLALSAREARSLSSLSAQLSAHTSILVGQSGVGKSSLAQALLPDQPVQIGRLSQATGLGCHTTSAATCYRLPGGGHLIDSPGVRSFRLPPLDRAGLEQGFREFHPYLGQCRFNDCRHDQEPGCALRAAVAAGALTPERLRVFHRLLAQLAPASGTS